MPHRLHRVPVAVGLAGIGAAVGYWLGLRRAATRRARAGQGALRAAGGPSALRKNIAIEVPVDELFSGFEPVTESEHPPDAVTEATLRGAKI